MQDIPQHNVSECFRGPCPVTVRAVKDAMSAQPAHLYTIDESYAGSAAALQFIPLVAVLRAPQDCIHTQTLLARTLLSMARDLVWHDNALEHDTAVRG